MEPSTSRLRDPLNDQFKSLVTPNDIKRRAYETFILELPYEKFGLFPFFRMTAQQNIYSSADLQTLAKATGSIGFTLEVPIGKCFEKRVSLLQKEAGFIAHIRRRNAENLLRHFIFDPAVLDLRGSSEEELIDG